MRDTFALVQLLKTLHDRQDDSDDNSFDNTIIQFFQAPHDTTTLTALIQTFINGATITVNPAETASLTASITPTLTNPSTLTWGGYDGSGTYHNAGWSWGYGGRWAGTTDYTLTLHPLILHK